MPNVGLELTTWTQTPSTCWASQVPPATVFKVCYQVVIGRIHIASPFEVLEKWERLREERDLIANSLQMLLWNW